MSAEQSRLVRTQGPPVPPKRVLARDILQDFSIRSASSREGRKQSAVERLEADKVKYVKSQQVAQTRQQPFRAPPTIRKPLLSPGSGDQARPGNSWPVRKVQSQSTSQPGSCQLDLEHLNKLINGVHDSPAHNTPAEPVRSQRASNENPPMRALPEASEAQGSATVTVRRVDVLPHVPQLRKAGRMPHPGCLPSLPMTQSPLLQLLKSQVLPKPAPLPPGHAKFPPNQLKSPVQFTPLAAQMVPSPTQACPPAHQNANGSGQTGPSPSPPVVSPVPSPKTPGPGQPSAARTPTSAGLSGPFSPTFTPLPPSPAITRLSSTSSRKRPSLTRSKSDVSDRFSRVGADLERFFNYCGLDPTDLDELAQSASEIASVSRLRSASAPASEHTAEGEEPEDEEEEQAQHPERPAYGISVIERNARVIKWLYGIRQARDPAKVANV
ncbi:protein FAM110A [Denticeps clupeoides]|uniref:Uncharacterized protein n=1 Tax=Denticeps clupeoides TaxID=299321 RepID=A0AAY4EFI0_9TELE|nr:protein FAM110A-like [Denticeps clupeoides]XP_028850116.1 protein FAM110A-like [Denticeps clupeoides]